MYKKLLGGLLCCLMAFTACDNDNKNEFHRLNFFPALSSGKIWFADQSTDSIVLQTTDSWKLTVEPLNGNDKWLTATPESGTVPPNHIAAQRLTFAFAPNTTGKIRTARLNVTTTTDKVRGISLPATQTSWLDVRRPQPVFPRPIVQGKEPKSKYNGGEPLPVFVEVLNAKAGTTQCAFRLYDTDTEKHSLTSDADWLIVPAESAKPGAGAHNVKITYLENPDPTPRTAHLVLTSGGVTTYITYNQNARSK